MAPVSLFLSAVSAEFRSHRDALRHDLDRPNVTVKVQEDFIPTGSETLDKLDIYLAGCDAVIHLVGDLTGALAQPSSLALIRQRYPDLGYRLPPLAPFLEDGAPALSYTQWEAWLALYHGKTLLIAVPEDAAPRDAGERRDEAQRAAQQAHLARLAEVGRYPEIRFANADRLAVELLRSTLHEILARAGVRRRPANLPFGSLDERFKGRDAALDELAKSLGAVPASATAVVARVVNGIGGVGKTRLALEYAWRHADHYSALLFVGAESPAALQRNLAALCRAGVLDLPAQHETHEGRQYDAVCHWLCGHPGWLLIVDNVDSEDAAAAAEALLPRLAGGHVVLSSRLANWSGRLALPPLDVLARAAAAEFLLVRTQERRRPCADDAALARQLADELGGLALALEQAGAYIAKRRLSCAQYLDEWRSQRDEVLAWYDARLMHYPKSVAITWQTSFDRLSEPARRLLQRLAWLAPEPIPESLLAVALPEEAGEARATAGAPADSLAALVELESYSLVRRASDAPSFTIHRLLQDVSRRRRDDAALRAALAWVDAAFVGDPGDVRDWPRLDPLAPHALSVAAYADAAGIADPTARLLNEVGLLLLAKARYAEAEPLLRRALAIDEAGFGDAHPDVARDLNNLAQLLQATNRLAEAEPLMRRALAIDEASFGDAHPEVARDLNNLAGLLQATNRLAEAEPLMRRALAIDEASFGDAHPNVARDLNNLATLLQDTNRLAEAEPLMRRALAIAEASFGDAHPEVAIDLNSLAQLLQATHRLAEAEPLLRRALAIDEASFGDAHPKVAIRLNNLAQLLKATNRLAEAEPLMHRALAIAEASFGDAHPDVAIDLNNLARLLQDTNRLAEAEPLMRRALAIDEASFGGAHPTVAIDLNNLAQLLQDTDRLAEAEPLLRRALAIAEASFGGAHPRVATHLNNLARLLQATKRRAEAEPLMRRALAIDEASLGDAQPNVAIRLNNLATLLQDTKRLAEAEPLMRRALAIDEASFGDAHPRVATHLYTLARLLQDTNRLAEAEPLMRRALAIDEASFGDAHPNVARDLNTLARLLQDTKRLAEAEPLLRRALRIVVASLGSEHRNSRIVRDNTVALLQAMGRSDDEIADCLASDLGASADGDA